MARSSAIIVPTVAAHAEIKLKTWQFLQATRHFVRLAFAAEIANARSKTSDTQELHKASFA
jgi:hypothetical protein